MKSLIDAFMGATQNSFSLSLVLTSSDKLVGSFGFTENFKLNSRPSSQGHAPLSLPPHTYHSIPFRTVFYACRSLLLPTRDILYAHLENWPVMMEMGRFQDLLPNLEKNIPIHTIIL